MPFKDEVKKKLYYKEYRKKYYNDVLKHNKEYLKKRNEKAREYQRELRKNHPEKKKLSNYKYLLKKKGIKLSINYKQLSEGLIDTLCEREDVTEVIILLLNKGYSKEQLRILNFDKGDVDIASEELERRIKENE